MVRNNEKIFLIFGKLGLKNKFEILRNKPTSTRAHFVAKWGRKDW